MYFCLSEYNIFDLIHYCTWGSEDGSRNENSDTGGFPDPRRQSIAEGSNFFPSDPSVSPTFDNSSPSAPPPTYGSGYSPMVQPYASSTNTFEHLPGLNPHNPPNVNTYNPPQQSDDLFPDLPPSYEVAMMDESDMCWLFRFIYNTFNQNTSSILPAVTNIQPKVVFF